MIPRLLPIGLTRTLALGLALGLAAGAAPVAARDSLGMFGAWGAFRDPAVPRCYAIAMAEPSSLAREFQPYAAVGTWPRQGERGQVHLHLSRRLAPGRPVTLTIGGQRFVLVSGAADAWAQDRRMDAAIVAALRSAPTMAVSARDAAGRSFGNSWRLDGAATAMDAATVGCARLR
ncbi:hypothetical protein ACFOD9_02505 [Novosphingobium bradum]|uniref:Uncharacterized protein n=1 Tax=Novosphingobium bradum TaxID=1737444 RepID=A0ABV7IK90_9SPHN